MKGLSPSVRVPMSGIFYAIADGLGTLFSRHGRWNGLGGPDRGPEEACQLILAL